MVDSADQDLQVILIVEDADLVSDFQQRFAARGMTVRFAEDPGGARDAVSSLRPKLVVIPVEGACLALLEAWALGEVPADAVLGLLTPPANASAAPKSVNRTARRGRSEEILSLAELMLRRRAKAPDKAAPPSVKSPLKLPPEPVPGEDEPKAEPPPKSEPEPEPESPPPPPPPKPEPEPELPKPEPPKPPKPEPPEPESPVSESVATVDTPEASIWNQPGGILKNLEVKKLVEGEEEEPEEVDLDPSRVSDIRSLGVAVRMAKATRGSDDSGPKAASPALNLSHSGDPDDAARDQKRAGITDALALLPEARAAESEEDVRERLTAKRESEAEQLQPTTRDPTAFPTFHAPVVVMRKKRRWPLFLVLALLVLGGGGAALYYFVLRAKPKAQKPSKPVAAAPAPVKRVKRGLHEDHFAGTIAQLPKTVTALDVDVSDEYLNRSVPELNPFIEKALLRMSRNKRFKALMDRGTKLLKWERYPEARRFLRRAVELKEDPAAQAALARAYEGLGRIWASIQHLRRAVKKAPKNADYRAKLGLMYLKEDRKKNGCRALKRAAKLDKAHRSTLDKHCGKGKRRRRRRRRR